MNGGILAFIELAVRLKRVRRQGWIDRGVADPESSAGHSWSVALLAWLLATDRPELNPERVLLLGLIHDLPEALAGDATPFDAFRDHAGVIPAKHFSVAPQYDETARRQKSVEESDALTEMCRHLPDDLAGEVRSAWHEYEAAETPEARFVKEIDKLETLIQAEIYKREQPEITIESFRQGTPRDVSDPMLTQVLKALKSTRDIQDDLR